MLARRNRRAGMPDADGGIAGRFHYDVHGATGNRAHAVIGEGGPRDPLRIPADGAAGFAGAVAIDVDDDGHFKPRRVRHLRQKHRAEFSGADQRDADRLAGRKAGVEEAMKVHGRNPTSKIDCEPCGVSISSWPGLSRPSTSFVPPALRTWTPGTS